MPAPIKALILDMDGVLWRGDQPLGNLPAVFEALSCSGLKVALATNNATLTIAQYQAKLTRFGVSLEDWQIINSPQAAAHELQQRFAPGASVYTIGEAGLDEALLGAGYRLYAEGDTGDPVAVVVGLDRSLTYDKLDRANDYIRRGALFVGTNPDLTFPLPGRVAPGAGAILAAIQASTGMAPVVPGKPQPDMYRIGLERLGTQAAETLVVGDRLDTDIAGAQAIGCPTALVLSGVTTEQQAHSWKPAPEIIAADLTAVLAQLLSHSRE